ncbi:MAG: molybdenum cofactor biosynthesis protein MoaE [Pseudomonadota bacterium]
MLTISDAPIDAAELLEAFETTVASAGAIVTFSGNVRGQSDAGRVHALNLQDYSPMTQTGIAAAMDDANRNWPLLGLSVAHRTGRILAGETIVFVAAASAHRRAAFEAADFLMDYLKTKAVFWKKEETETGAVWIEPRAQDYEDAQRWRAKETTE